MPTPMPTTDDIDHQPASKRFWHFMALRGVPLGLFAAGFAFLYLGIMLVQDAKNAVNWPSVEGTILSSSVSTVKQTKGRKKTFHYPHVVYEYVQDGEVKQSDRLSMSDMGYSKMKLAKVIVDDYPKGSKHPVYIDPQNSSVTILRPGEDSIAEFALWFGVGFIAVGLFAFWGLPRVANKVRFYRGD
ncbi:MAG: DUF3592 domain-containing protein [Cohaesibacter sp.]|jgi:hypothetical protein|nr:DUF3592 domain-containing protein [Cohaesibacter sp.]